MTQDDRPTRTERAFTAVLLVALAYFAFHLVQVADRIGWL